MASVFKRGGSKTKGYWYAAWTDHRGLRKTQCTKTTDKATAERIAKKHEADAALRRDGVIDPTLDAIGKESQRSIEAHLEDYESKLRAANRTNKHVRSTLVFIGQIAEYAEFRTAADIDADGVNKYAGKLRDEGRAARTIGAHLNAIKSFTKWLASHHKLPRDPLISIKKPNPETDRRRERRMLLPDEWHRLETATLVGGERYGMAAGERLTLYRTAIQTGLRSNELRSLTRGNLYLNGKQPSVTCKAGSTKNRKPAQLFIQPELASELRSMIARKSPKVPVFNLPHESKLAGMLRDDLSQARKAWLAEVKHDPDQRLQREQCDFLCATNDDNESFDFHCLRHTCGAWLAMAGVHPKTVQTVMRHSSITLTMDTYGHLFPGQEADAVGRMRGMLSSSGPDRLQATGTNDQRPTDPKSFAQRLAQRAVCVSEQTDAKRCDGKSPKRAQKKSPKPLQIADLGDVVRDDALASANSGGGIRTPDTRIMILRLVLPNSTNANNLQQQATGCCPNSCPSVEVEPDLVKLVASWQKMSPRDKKLLAAISDCS